MTERRTSRRYNLCLPVKIRILGQIDSVACNGETRDISTQGVYFIIGNYLNVGAELDLAITLPAEITGGAEVLVRTRSTVLRVERSPVNDDNPRMGVAALFKRYEIIRNGSART